MVCTDKTCKELEYVITDAELANAIKAGASDFAKDPTDANAPNLTDTEKKKIIKEVLASRKTRTKCDDKGNCRCIIFPKKLSESEPFDVEESGINVTFTKGGQPHKYVLDLKATVTLKETDGICVPKKGSITLAMQDTEEGGREKHTTFVIVSMDKPAKTKRRVA
jgi:hypothetical protein